MALPFDKTRLGRLAAEMRNKIFEFAVTHEAVPHSLDYQGSKTIHLQYMGQFNQLTRTCRQVRAETHPLFFAKNRFQVQINLTNKHPYYILEKNLPTLSKLDYLFAQLGSDVVSVIGCVIFFKSISEGGNNYIEIHGDGGNSKNVTTLRAFEMDAKDITDRPGFCTFGGEIEASYKKLSLRLCERDDADEEWHMSSIMYGRDRPGKAGFVVK
ncbi:hypothetical protein LTR56_001593 [Elasticomyces elasticus]|nr:hypothetical protein LTR56_001593 [Elasticomyces elasticus]KAK4932565.1 hypothetical protein LTR49_000989 [Elasticomyces elasticus]KAK5769587.1 hypothetical protein LTS12_000037 [Elasticomyces elasticus]